MKPNDEVTEEEFEAIMLAPELVEPEVEVVDKNPPLERDPGRM